jgi:exodeoxyribonuclease VII small subunit
MSDNVSPPPDDSPELPPLPTFEQAISELETIVREMEEGQIGLSESLAHYERGVKLLRHCHALLQQAEQRIALVSGVDAEGREVSTPLADRGESLEEKARSRSRRRSAEGEC